ncbi:Probable ATP-dependent helicase lhr, partial [hydrothermal vent metagenome]
LVALRNNNRVVEGTFRPGGSGREWVDRDVLRLIKRRSLAKLRNEIEAVDQHTFAAFLVDWHGIGSTSAHTDRLTTIIGQLQGRSLPASTLESEVLAVRMSYNPAHLDELLANGDIVWVGAGGLGGYDGRVRLLRRSDVHMLGLPATVETPDDPTQRAIVDHLREHGASFFTDVYGAAGGGDPGLVVDALWALAWTGVVTNDTLQPLRSRVHTRGRKRSARSRPRRISTTTPPSATGRWSLVDRLVATAPPVTEEQRATALVDTLLDRHGILTRDGVRGEDVPGGFSRLYPVLAAMEASGLLRRGYFIEGLGGAQFARPTAVDQLRDRSARSPVAISATDPAQPYGSTLPWPEMGSVAPQRRPGHGLALLNGAVIAYWNRNAKHVATLAGANPRQVVSAMLTLGNPEEFSIETVDGVTPPESVLAAALNDAGFAPGYRGWTLRPDRAKR